MPAQICCLYIYNGSHRSIAHIYSLVAAFTHKAKEINVIT